MNSSAAYSTSHPAIAWGTVLARWILGIVFIYAGMNKAMDPVGFLKLTRQYDLVHFAFGLNFIAIVVPWFEVFCGLLLVSGVAVRGSALILALMLGAFTVVVIRRALVLQAHMEPAVAFCSIAFDCGCGTGPVLICRKIAENAGLFLLAVGLTCLPCRKGCLRHQLFQK